MPRAERRPVVEAKRSGEYVLAAERQLHEKGEIKEEEKKKHTTNMAEEQHSKFTSMRTD
jgi:hypothetical protein